MKKTKADSKKLYTVYPQEERIPLTISELAEAQIKYLCKQAPNEEWAGIIYLKEEGDFFGEDFKLEVVYVHVMVIDSAASFTWEMDDSIIDLYEKHPELEELQMGLIHSHNKMSVHFSSTDTDELHDNVDKYNYYTSVIVNNNFDVIAKVARLTEIESTIKFRGKGLNKFLFGKKKEEAMVINDCTIYTFYTPVEDYYKKRFEELKKEKSSRKLTTTRFGSEYKGYGNQTNFVYDNDYYKDSAFVDYYTSGYELLIEVCRIYCEEGNLRSSLDAIETFMVVAETRNEATVIEAIRTSLSDYGILKEGDIDTRTYVNDSIDSIMTWLTSKKEPVVAKFRKLLIKSKYAKAKV